MTGRKIYPFDTAILSYVFILTLLIFIFGRPLSLYYEELTINLGYVLVAFLAVFFLHNNDSKVARLFRLLYPALLFTFFYRQTGGLMKLIFPEFLDYQLTAFEKSIFGVNPTFWIEQNVLNVWLTEILSATYFLYYPMIGVYLLILYFKKRFQLVKQSQTAIAVTFFISYMLFYFYPIEGPRYFFEGQYMFDITGLIFRPLVELAQQGSVRGGCMPSSHIAVALVINIFCLKHFKKVGILLLINNIGMALGTFYGRYHYVSDVVVGAAIGIAVTWLTLKYYDRFDHPETSTAGSSQE